MRRAAVGQLGAATEAARELAARLRADTRGLHDIATVDDPEIGERWYSPVYGPGNPVAPPMEASSTPEGTATGRVTLGKPHEGPPGCGATSAS